MKRELWKVADNELYVLRDRAHENLTQLNLRFHIMIGHVENWEFALEKMDPRDQRYGPLLTRIRGVHKHLDILGQQIAAQRTFVQSLDNEYTRRNPPFWTSDDLDRINRQR